MELDLQSLFEILRVQLNSLAETPQLPPPPAFGLTYEGAIGQPRLTASLCNPLMEMKMLWIPIFYVVQVSKRRRKYWYRAHFNF